MAVEAAGLVLCDLIENIILMGVLLLQHASPPTSVLKLLGVWMCGCIVCVQAHVCGGQRTTSSVITYFENVSQWPGVC